MKVTRSWIAPLAVAAVLAGPAVATAQNWQANPQFGTVNLRGNFDPDPNVTSMVAGGRFNASNTGSNCTGFIDGDRPSVDLNYERAGANYPLTIYAESSEDLVLVVNLPNGTWVCNDDYSGTNPAIRLDNPLSGNYNIFVGTFEAGRQANATLSITEMATVMGVSGGSGGGGGGNAANIEWGDNTSRWANDGECDDPRFAGPGAAETLLDEDRFHDANDCRNLYMQGQIYLR